MAESAWLLTLGISPRRRLRIYEPDETGVIGNDRLRQVPIRTDARPATPWAIYLADENHHYQLLAFDLDAKGGRDSAAVEADVDKITGWCAELGIATLVCASGPTGGRHIWLGLAEPADAGTIRALAVDVRRLCPTLDVAPLTNPATGCVRPPWSPHRHGGHSTPVHGHLRALLNPTTTTAHLNALHRLVLEISGEHAAPVPAAAGNPPTGVLVDDYNITYLPGRRRELNPTSAQLLRDPLAPATDASAVMWRVLLGAAAARWRYADMLAAMRRGDPGLEHGRTARLRPDAPQRRPRPRSGLSRPAQVLRRMWDRAVATVASLTPSVRHDPTWEPRTAALAQSVAATQARADAATGRWASSGGPADRRVLDALCLMALQGVVDVIDADVRRLSALTGIHHSTAARALGRLTADGWITQVSPTEGPHAASWKLGQADIHSITQDAATQALGSPPSRGNGPTHRTHWFTRLTERLAAAAHDAFTPRAAGLHTGNAYARYLENPEQDLRQPDSGRLHAHALLTPALGSGDPRTAIAQRYGTTGILSRRLHQHRVDRLAWAWWRAELDWMTRQKRPDRPGPEQPALLTGPTTWPPHPRRNDGRADYAAARRLLNDRPSAATNSTEQRAA